MQTLETLQSLFSNPALIITTILTIGVILVNGWTDAPNAIATAIGTRAMKPRSAIIMAAVFNFLGVFVMTMINTNVVVTISNMVDFGGDPHAASVALMGALASIVIWATAAWYFGIPHQRKSRADCRFNRFRGGVSGQFRRRKWRRMDKGHRWIADFNRDGFWTGLGNYQTY